MIKNPILAKVAIQMTKITKKAIQMIKNPIFVDFGLSNDQNSENGQKPYFAGPARWEV